jgi:hypothetical protein
MEWLLRLKGSKGRFRPIQCEDYRFVDTVRGKWREVDTLIIEIRRCSVKRPFWGAGERREMNSGLFEMTLAAHDGETPVDPGSVLVAAFALKVKGRCQRNGIGERHDSMAVGAWLPFAADIGAIIVVIVVASLTFCQFAVAFVIENHLRTAVGGPIAHGQGHDLVLSH